MSRSDIATAIAGIALVALLTGCSSPETAPSPSPSASAVASASPSASPPPAPSKPALDELVLTPDGLGPLVPGAAPPATDPALDILVFDADHCAGIEYADSVGMWVANYEPALTSDSNQPFAVGMSGDVIGVIGAFDGTLSTEAGISIGSSRAELLAAYPGGFSATLSEPGMSTIYTIDGSVGFMQIEVGPADGGEGYADTVFAITIVPAGTQPFGFWATDRSFGFCTHA